MKMLLVRDPDELPGAIRTALKHRGMGQAQLARDLGYSAKHVNQMLQGNAGISIEMLFRIMQHLDVAVVFAPEQSYPPYPVNGWPNAGDPER